MGVARLRAALDAYPIALEARTAMDDKAPGIKPRLRCRPSTPFPLRSKAWGGRDARAFTPVCDGLCAAMTTERF